MPEKPPLPTAGRVYPSGLPFISSWTWAFDLGRGLMDAEEGLWAHLGFGPRDGISPGDFLRLVHRKDIGNVMRAFRDLEGGNGDRGEAEWRMMSATGEWKWFRGIGTVVERAADGTARQLAGSVTAIDREKAGASELRRAEAVVSALFRSSPDPMLFVLDDLTIAKVNRPMVQLTERVLGQAFAPGTNLLDYPLMREFKPFVDELDVALSGATFTVEREFQLPGRPAGWFEGAFSPVYDDDGESIGATIILRSVTQQKLIDRARLQAAKLEGLGLMAGGIVHDFRNLLTAALGNTELAALATEDAAVRENLAEARGAMLRAAEMLNQILAFANPRGSSVQEVRIPPMVEEMVRYAGQMPGSPVPIRTELGETPVVEGDPIQIRQMLLNLVLNAVEATRDAGTLVTVRTGTITGVDEFPRLWLFEPRRAERYCVVEIADDGPGMDPETLGRIFDPFFTTKETGNGLGLASVLGTIQSHSGAISVESEPGRGSTFTVVFPAR